MTVHCREKRFNMSDAEGREGGAGSVSVKNVFDRFSRYITETHFSYRTIMIILLIITIIIRCNGGQTWRQADVRNP